MRGLNINSVRGLNDYLTSDLGHFDVTTSLFLDLTHNFRLASFTSEGHFFKLVASFFQGNMKYLREGGGGREGGREGEEGGRERGGRERGREGGGEEGREGGRGGEREGKGRRSKEEEERN